jgi:hypothetical protein
MSISVPKSFIADWLRESEVYDEILMDTISIDNVYFISPPPDKIQNIDEFIEIFDCISFFCLEEKNIPSCFHSYLTDHDNWRNLLQYISDLDDFRQKYLLQIMFSQCCHESDFGLARFGRVSEKLSKKYGKFTIVGFRTRSDEQIYNNIKKLMQDLYDNDISLFLTCFEYVDIFKFIYDYDLLDSFYRDITNF